MSIQDEIIIQQRGVELLKKMQTTDFHTVPIDTPFRVADSLNELLEEASTRHFSHVDPDVGARFFANGCTSYTDTAGTHIYPYWELVDTGEAKKEGEFREFLASHSDTAGKIHVHRSCFPKDLPRNYLEILKENL